MKKIQMKVSVLPPKGQGINDDREPLLQGNSSVNKHTTFCSIFKTIVQCHPKAETVWKISLFTAFVHLISACSIIPISRSSTPEITANVAQTTPYMPAFCFNGTDAEDSPIFTNKFDYIENTKKTYLTFLVFTFFLLSAFFQFFDVIQTNNYFARLENNGVCTFRYAEYTLSASVMMIAIACSLQLYDLFLHVLLFSCTALCMILGYVTDEIRTHQEFLQKEWDEAALDKEFEPKVKVHLDQLKKLKWFTHCAGWFAIIAPFVVIIWSFDRTIDQVGCESDAVIGTDDTPLPVFVYMIVISQVLLFANFGLVQLQSFFPIDDPCRSIGILTEFHFVLLSIIAKSILGWIIVANILLVT
jgi:hypothetical protein